MSQHSPAAPTRQSSAMSRTRTRITAAFRSRPKQLTNPPDSRSTTGMRSTAVSRINDFVSSRGPASTPPVEALQFERVDLSESRLDAFHGKAHDALSHTIAEFVKLGDKPIDTNRWRFLRSRGGASVYYDRRPLNQRLSSLLVAGTIKASLVDIMEGLYMDNTEDTRLVQHQLSPRFMDAKVLKVIEHRSAAHPHAFTGIKWSLIKTSASSIVSNRDICFLEKLGVLNIAGGRKLGYFIMQSVDMPECPPPKSSKVIRAHVSLCYLFEELDDGIVGVYMTGSMESNGPQMLWKMARNNFADIALSIGDSVSLANAKRYAQLMRSKQQLDASRHERSLVCEVCQCLPSFFDHHHECSGCIKLSVCKRCRIRRDVFSRESDSSLRLVTASFCIDCVESVRHPAKPKPAAPFFQPVEFEEEDGISPRLKPRRKFSSHASSAYATTDDDESSDENMPDSERSLRRFSLKLLQQLEDAGYSQSDADLRLSDLRSLGVGEMRDLCKAANESDESESESESESEPEVSDADFFAARGRPAYLDSSAFSETRHRTKKGYANVSVASSVFSIGDIDVDDYSDEEEDEDEVEVVVPQMAHAKSKAAEEEEEEEDEEEEILSIRPLRRSTQPPEMLEAQQLNRDGSLRARMHAQSCPEPFIPPQQEQGGEGSMMRRLMQVSIAAEQTLRYTREQFERANKRFPSSQGAQRY